MDQTLSGTKQSMMSASTPNAPMGGTAPISTPRAGGRGDRFIDS